MVPLWLIRNMIITVVLISTVALLLLIKYSPDKERLLQDYGLNHRDGKTSTELMSIAGSVAASYIIDILCLVLASLSNPGTTFVLAVYSIQTVFWTVLLVLFMLSGLSAMASNPATAVALTIVVAAGIIE